MDELNKKSVNKDIESLQKLPYEVLVILRDLALGDISKEEADELLLPFLGEKQVS